MAGWTKVGLQLRGKARRFVQSSVFPSRGEALVANRRGDCDRCGECCKILFRCPFLKEDGEGQYSCRIYQQRFSQCRLYPLQARDLLEVSRCSYTFANPEPVPVGALTEPALD